MGCSQESCLLRHTDSSMTSPGWQLRDDCHPKGLSPAAQAGSVKAGRGGGSARPSLTPSSSPGSCLLPFRALSVGRVQPRDC